jgi:transposase
VVVHVVPFRKTGRRHSPPSAAFHHVHHRAENIIQIRFAGLCHLHKYAVRLQTILLRNKGKGTCGISEFLVLDQSAASLYINRYNELGIDGLLRDKTRKPGKEPISHKTKEEICHAACREKPKDETRWIMRTLAKRVGIGRTAVNTILRKYGLKSHLASTFQAET